MKKKKTKIHIFAYSKNKTRCITCTGETICRFGSHCLIVERSCRTGVIVGVLCAAGAVIPCGAGVVCVVSCALQAEVAYTKWNNA